MDSPSLTKYRGICAETVTRLYAGELEKRKNAKEAEKALKTALHQITGAFMTEGELKRARKLLNEGAPIRELLALHASTRERLAHIDAFYAALLPSASPRLTILDLACGLNPLYLGSLGHSVYGVDISGGCVDLINSAARKMNWDVSAVCRDLMCDPPLPEADAALAMKLLPVLEQQKKGAALSLLQRIPAPVILVTFPTKTLGGRGVGMEKHYSDWFESLVRGRFDIARREVLFDELCYTVKTGKTPS